MALQKLQSHGHRVVLVNPNEEKIDGLPVLHSLGDISDAVDTLTIYLRPEITRGLIQEILHLRPGRVILNPGTEDAQVMNELTKHGIPFQKACTLVLLSTDQF